MLLVATDEAGYGPKLGPMIVAATAWQVPEEAASTQQTLVDAFASMRQPVSCGGVSVTIDDSKAIYRPGVADALQSLHAAISAAIRWTGSATRDTEQWVREVAGDDNTQLGQVPWLGNITNEVFFSAADTAPVIASWSDSGIRLVDVRARIVTASSFNRYCDAGANKADLLSETTLVLVRGLLDTWGQGDDSITVFCDRHGGRRYYSGVLQHVFPDTLVTVFSESKHQSSYRFDHNTLPAAIHFTVKGDSFTPVAMSSIVAKYLRERLMQSFNRYFASHHRGPQSLKPTAGYPVDADRFLQDVRPIIDRENISLRDLVRTR